MMLKKLVLLLIVLFQGAMVADYFFVVRPQALCAHGTAVREAPYMEQLIELHKEWLKVTPSASEKGHVK